MKDAFAGIVLALCMFGAFVMFISLAVVSHNRVARLARVADQTRTEFLRDMERAEITTLVIKPAELVTPSGGIPAGGTRVCTALPVTPALRKLDSIYWINFQSNSEPTFKSPRETMSAFPSLNVPQAWYLMPPIAEGGEFGIQLSVRRDHGAYSEDRWGSRVFRFRARGVPGSNPPRFRLERLNEVDMEIPYLGRGLL